MLDKKEGSLKVIWLLCPQLCRQQFSRHYKVTQKKKYVFTAI